MQKSIMTLSNDEEIIYYTEYSIVKIGSQGNKTHIGMAMSSIRESDFGKMHLPEAWCESGGYSRRYVSVIAKTGVHKITCKKCQEMLDSDIVNLDDMNREDYKS